MATLLYSVLDIEGVPRTILRRELWRKRQVGHQRMLDWPAASCHCPVRVGREQEGIDDRGFLTRAEEVATNKEASKRR